MTALWPSSRTMLIRDRDPIVGAQARFYNSGTTTPQPVYQDAALSVVHDQPVETDADGLWPAVYLNTTPGSYRVRVEDDDDVVIWDDDDVSVPQDADYVPPDAGETSVELLARTGDLKHFYGTSAPSGWVRAAGRTIGSATSGASERANADCEDLFLHLWGVDSNLAVSGGRGGSAAGDWAANKTIALPDFRERVLAGLATMGNSDAGRVDDAYVTAGTNTSTLGAIAGLDDVVLTEAQLAAHDHDATFTGQAMAAHGHPYYDAQTNVGVSSFSGTMRLENSGSATLEAANTGAADGSTKGKVLGGASAGTPEGTIDVADAGSGSAHNNMQPTAFVLVLIKL